jgi:hypothetical protein
VRAIIVPAKSVEADPTILDRWSANLTLPGLRQSCP